MDGRRKEMGRGKSTAKKRAKKIREKNEASLVEVKEIGNLMKQEKELQEWKTTLVTSKKCPRYV